MEKKIKCVKAEEEETIPAERSLHAFPPVSKRGPWRWFSARCKEASWLWLSHSYIKIFNNWIELNDNISNEISNLVLRDHFCFEIYHYSKRN